MKRILMYLLLLLNVICNAQYTSIHTEQSSAYKAIGALTAAGYDSIQGFTGRLPAEKKGRELQKRVFGYHPYWIGNSWQNYQWDLLSDLCYFSYETDPATGNPFTTNEFESAEVIDTALSHGVRVHLCITLFSDHAAFFANPLAKQTLISNVISLLAQRGVTGVNIDFESVPSSQQQGLTDFLIQISEALHTNIPGSELSIAAPAVNWDNTFDLPAIIPALDLIMIMAYDYYWSGSSLAGPVSGFWPLTPSFDYAVNRSLCYYQNQGVPNEKLLLGLPYYGREWRVNSNTLPATTAGSGTALTYRVIRNNGSGNYSPQNLYWDNRSHNPYYGYFSNYWYQCFFDDTKSLGAKYDLVNRRNTGGIGIWALGYDNGYQELWDLIAEKFTDSPAALCRDTLFDSGGPWWNYGDNETYAETVISEYPGPLNLHFELFNLEPGYDSLWIYDGMDTNSPLLSALSGDQVPTGLGTSSNSFTIRFNSDGATVHAGYTLVWSCPTASMDDINFQELSIFPNPAEDLINIILKGNNYESWSLDLFDINGKRIKSKNPVEVNGFKLDISNCNSGIYILKIYTHQKVIIRKVLITH